MEDAEYEAQLREVRDITNIEPYFWKSPPLYRMWKGWRSPEYLLWFMGQIDLAYPYGMMVPEEVSRVCQGESKFVRILVVYCRRYLENRARIRRKWSYLHYVSRYENFWIQLPTWVQEIDRTEWDHPSEDFFKLRERIRQYTHDWVQGNCVVDPEFRGM